ncbi:MAG TPA: sigma-70 family RNA polymerase sigma factor [Bacteroidia bacterium]|nr:sigma-70 family RNA polymerase sigma factor [Sphingobacteriales bacterium]HPD65831.1 sigma-70 family RNA polymerase sigma factor [Bacteroidia bacterium]HRS59734.1 sigma-70 family RNA polymerase sigma factor [Bacteroidia bacterium]HRU68174.1 sigma-70 family RNA polymerase sigma factor [Bacteroidia bacterium]
MQKTENKNYFTDEDLIQGIINDEEEALKKLYKNYFGMVSAMIMNNNGSYQEAKDIYQDTIVIFLDKIKNTEFTLYCKIKTYVYSIARKLWLNELKSRNLNSSSLIDSDEIDIIDNDDISFQVEQEEKIKNLNNCLTRLGEPCRTLIESFYFEKLSMNEIAETMGYNNAETAKNLKYKCLQRLKKLFFEIK